MKNTLLTILVLILSGTMLFAQNKQKVDLSPDANAFSVTSKTTYGFEAEAQIAGFEAIEVTTKGGEFIQLATEGYLKSFTVGVPNLPSLGRLIEIPQGAVADIEIISFDEEIIKLADYGITKQIIPGQPSVSKSDDPATLPFYKKDEVYAKDEFIGQKVVKVEKVGMMRGTRIARLGIYPFSYNPVTNTVKIVSNLKFKVTFAGADMSKTDDLKNRFYTPYQDGILGNLINYDSPKTKEIIFGAPVKYVIVSDRMFEAQLQEFITWKRKKGFNVIEAYTDDAAVGNTTTSIKDYLSGLYNSATATDPAPTFILFVGDIQQIPAFSGSVTNGSHVSDLYYCEYTGDFIPEVYYGRFSAQTTAQLQPQIDKTLQYEQFTMPDPTYLDEVLMVAGEDAGHQMTWGNGQINYGTENYFNATNGLTSHTYLQPEPSGVSYSTELKADISAGVSYANYSAHCNWDGWSAPSFRLTDIPNLTNANKYSLWIGNCCLSVKFDENECFGEAALRVADKGAIGDIGGSNSTYWDEDFWWGVGFEPISANPTFNAGNYGVYDRMFHNHPDFPADVENWYVTQGQIFVAGNLAVEQSTTARKRYYWEIYHLMGDPSLMVYMGNPPAMTANYLSTLMIGMTSLDVTTVPYAYVALSFEGQQMAVAFADVNGAANLTFDAIDNVGDLDLVITAQNTQPHIGTIQAVPAEGPYVVLDQCVLDDADGNGQADYNEAINLDVQLLNVGVEVASGVTAVLSTTDDNVAITSDSYTFGDITASGTVSQTAAFAFIVNNDVADQHIVEFTVTMTSTAKTTWTSTTNVVLNAPVLESGLNTLDVENNFAFTTSAPVTAVIDEEYTYDVAVEGTTGDGNGRLDPGETVEISFTIDNEGHSTSPVATATLTTSSDLITVLSDPASVSPIDAAGNQVATFLISTDASAEIGSSAGLQLDISYGSYSITENFDVKIGLSIEDFESGDFSSYSWTQGGEADWSVVDSESHDGTYSAKSGTVEDNEKSELSIDVDVPLDDQVTFWYKVSSEGGYDDLYFYIDGNELLEINGEVDWTEATFPVSAGTHTLKWAYEKDVSQAIGDDCAWIDDIILPSGASKDGVRSISFTATTKPEWLTLTDNGDGTAILAGTPQAANNGANPVVIEASNGTISGTQEFSIFVGITAIESTNGNTFAFNVFPNPVTETAFISYTTVENSTVSLVVYDITGKEVARLVNNQEVTAGTHKIELSNASFGSGVYFCKLSIGNEVVTAKIVITK